MMGLMATPVDGETIRRVLLEVVKEQSAGSSSFQQVTVLSEAAKRLSFQGQVRAEQALLTFWYDLFRLGQLSWGYNMANPNPPWCHLTEAGRKTLEHLSRDPVNPGGYLGHLSQRSPLNAIAESYIREALQTYNAGCMKATAVMTGAAAESLALELRDVLVTGLTTAGSAVPKAMTDWRIKTVLGAIEVELDKEKKAMPASLRDSFEGYWGGFTQQIRAARNDAGHPASVDPVTSEAVHASLLIFPELAALANNLKAWVSQHYV